jgi:hypothetical protein
LEPQHELLLIVALKALAELAGLFMTGRGLLYVLIGQKREVNGVYQLFSLLTNPLIHATRIITPRIVADRHIPFAAALLVFWVWLGATYWKAAVCTSGLVACMPQSH